MRSIIEGPGDGAWARAGNDPDATTAAQHAANKPDRFNLPT
ncbi:MAG TPA: hypothetical protein VF942_16205 [Acidimicrobiales bacterium]